MAEARIGWDKCEPFEITVHTAARRFTGREGAEYDDLVQEGWESVVTYLREGSQPDEESIERWMRAYIRQLGRLHKGDTSPPFVTGGTPVKPVTQIHIRDCLNSLPPELLTVALMVGFGYTFVEIGEHFGVHRTTASTWFKDACIRLRRTL